MTPGKFDNWKPRAHYLGLLMTDQGKSNSELYEDARSTWKSKLQTFTDMTDKQKDLVMGKKALEASDKAYNEMKRLEKIKHIQPLGLTCLTKLDEIYLEVTTGRKKIFENEYLEKGIMVEKDSITLYCQVNNVMLIENVVNSENDWIMGTMDVELDEETVMDIKSSWDIWTYNKSRRSRLSTLYFWQLIAYMWLFKKQKAKLAYCLVNTPEHLIRRQETRLMYEMFGSEQNYQLAPDYMTDLYKEGCEKIRKNHIFDDIEPARRVKTFDLEFDQTMVERIKSRVEYCRWYLNNYEELNYENES